MHLERGDRRKLSDRAREEIRAGIISGAYDMGDKLLEGALSEALGMSKSPIREALLQLESEGLVEMSPDRSARVFSMGRVEFEELGELRQILEREALRLAMARNLSGLIESLTPAVSDMQTAIRTGDDANYRMCDLAFHNSIFAACDNSYLRSSYQRLAFRVQALRNLLAGDAALNANSFAEHKAILDAIRTDERDKALALLQSHIRTTTHRYLARFATPDKATQVSARVALPEIERFCVQALEQIGADTATIDGITRALSHASGLGVDSHGYRLLPHYLAGLSQGRVNARPRLRLSAGRGGAAVLDADHAHGAVATFAAVEHALARARTHGVGAIAIRNSSHFGAAGAYAMAVAEAGMFGLVVCNSDSFVQLHGGAMPFHGTNPIAAAAPSDGPKPWLLDMATSSVPFNRVQLARATGTPLPPEVATDADGRFVTDAARSAMLAPLGGALFGFKGAGLAGLAEILSTALSDTPLSVELLPMISDDMTTPRGLGAFVLAVDPDAFAGSDVFRQVVTRYVDAVRASRRAGREPVRAAGDREWAEQARRLRDGIKLDHDTIRMLAEFAKDHGIAPLSVTEDAYGGKNA